MSTYGAGGTGVFFIYIRAAECAYLFPYGGAWRSAMRGFGGVASDNRQDSNQRRLGASAEGRLAWPQGVATAAGKDCRAGQQLATHVLAMGTPLGCDLRRRTSCLPPHRCAAHPEPLSSIDVYRRRRGDSVVVDIQSHDTRVTVFVWRGVAECDAGVRRRSQ